MQTTPSLYDLNILALSPAPPSGEHKDTSLVEHRTPVSALYVPLSILKDVLESTETLPCVKYVASVGVKIIEVAEEVQSNKTDLQDLALRAKDMIVTVADACRGVDQDDAEAQLERDLRQLTATMEEVLDFTRVQLTRKGYKRVLYKSEDAEKIKLLENKLNQAFKRFDVQGIISIRLNQRLMNQRLEDIQGHSDTLPMNCPLSIPEGIYIIRNSSTGNVLELGNGIRDKVWAPVYTSLQQEFPLGEVDLSQLWSVTAVPNREIQYHICNLAAGTNLEILYVRRESGARVGCFRHLEGFHQVWNFFGSKRNNTIDLCTIRSCGPATVLDAKCPVAPHCELAHCVTLDHQTATQEWSLIHIPLPPFILSPAAALFSTTMFSPSLPSLYHRPFYLQSVSSSLFATRTGAPRGQNVALQPDPTSASLWYFLYLFDPTSASSSFGAYFAIVSTSPDVMHRATLDHWIGDHICTTGYWPQNEYHKWMAVPRGDAMFSFRNMATGKLLAQARGGSKVVNTIRGDEGDDPACMWKVVHPDLVSSDGGRPCCPVVYDSTLSFPHPSLLLRSPSHSDPSASSSLLTAMTMSATLPKVDSNQPRIRVEVASRALQTRLTTTLKTRHEVLEELVDAGYSAFVVIPDFVYATKKMEDGRSRSIAVRLMDEGRMLEPRQYRESGKPGDVCADT